MRSPSPRRRTKFASFCLWLVAVALPAGLTGCGGGATPAAPGFDASTASLLARMADPLTLADLSIPGGSLLSSTDITGGNLDSADTAGKNGWVTLADLRGPGFVSRIWFAGWADYHRPLRFFFDDEPEPRIALTVNQFFGNTFPFQAPFARQENYCVYSVLPLPYAKRLRVEIQAKPDSRLYYQFNHTVLPPSSKVVSYSPTWSGEDKEAWKRAAAVLESSSSPEPAGMVIERRTAHLAPGASATLEPLKGPGIVREVRCLPRMEGTGAAGRAQALLRQANVQVRWNGSEFASIELPLGDFFGQNTRLTAYRSLAHASDGRSLSCRLPMPFETAVLSLVNTGDQTFDLDFEFRIEPQASLPPQLGYLHAGWQGSWPEDIGPPHAALRARGDGKYVGGVLSVDSASTGSWWGLEGDEILRMDDAFMPQWKGTGVEDHYNGGWYYRTAGAEALSGVVMRVPYQAVQYRWLVLEAPRFHASLDLHFERGGENEAPLLMDSSAWYYLSSPREADTDIPPFSANSSRSPARTEKLLASHLVELERFRDFTGCRRMIQAFLDENPQPTPTAERLRLLDLLYREHQEGPTAVEPALAEFRKTATLPFSSQSLDDRTWLRADASHALLQVASLVPVDVWYAGKPVATNAAGITRHRVTVPDGPTAVAVRATVEKPNGYLHVRLVSADREWVSNDTWRYQEKPAEGWPQREYVDAEWKSHFANGYKVVVPPETTEFPPGLFSRAENITRPVTPEGKSMVHRRVWTPADGRPLR